MSGCIVKYYIFLSAVYHTQKAGASESNTLHLYCPLLFTAKIEILLKQRKDLGVAYTVLNLFKLSFLTFLLTVATHTRTTRTFSEILPRTAVHLMDKVTEFYKKYITE